MKAVIWQLRMDRDWLNRQVKHIGRVECGTVIGGFQNIEPEQNDWHFVYSMLKCILLNEKFYILLQISLLFVCGVGIDNNSALVLVMLGAEQRKSMTRTNDCQVIWYIWAILSYIYKKHPIALQSGMYTNHWSNLHMGQVTKVWLSCYLVLQSFDVKTR